MKSVFFQSSPIRTVLLSFLALILTGTLLLMLPFSTKGGIGFIDALFTSTSAVCVTGLAVRDTARDFTLFGKAVIALLIQLGGLGIMTFSLALVSMFQESISIKWRFTFKEMYSDIRKMPVGTMVKRIVLYTFFMEALFALALFADFAGEFPLLEALGHSVFHSVSAFCNAGFSTFPDGLLSYRGRVFLNIIIILAIISGGLGFVAIHEIRRQFARGFAGGFFSGLSHHTRLVLVVTGILIAGGTAVILLMEWNYSLAGESPGTKFLASLFQSVTCRTAGFNTVDIAHLHQSTLLVMIILMFIGGSPGSIAGGVKTTTAGVAFIMLYSKFKGESQPVLWKRAIDRDTVDRSATLIILSLAFVLFSTFMVMITDNPVPGEHFLLSLFETVSAFGTVGLTAGATGSLSSAGKLIICAVMYVGRLGPLTLMAALTARKKTADFEYPEEHIMVG